MYNENAPEQRCKEQAIAQWIGRTGLPARIVEDEEFIQMMGSMDKKFNVPKRQKILNLIENMYMEEKGKIKRSLSQARRVTTGLDIWTKKGLTASFLGVSACYFNPESNKAEHKLLSLKELAHPHTGEAIGALVEESMAEWGIQRDKIITTITDNGSNMVASFRSEATGTSDCSEDEHSEDPNDYDVEGEDERSVCV